MKYTLFAFHLMHGDVEPQAGGPNEIGRVLAQTKKHRADICDGVYVFETQKGWQDMHRLRGQLVNWKREYVNSHSKKLSLDFFLLPSPIGSANSVKVAGKKSHCLTSAKNDKQFASTHEIEYRASCQLRPSKSRPRNSEER